MAHGIRVLWLAALLAACALQAEAGEKKKDEKRGGTIIGVLTAKGKDFVEVKAPGEEKGRRYVPHWVGGLPAQGGGPDKKVMKLFEPLKVGDRVRLDWEFEERPRVLRIEAIKGDQGKQDK
jgi:hypothetical protein